MLLTCNDPCDQFHALVGSGIAQVQNDQVHASGAGALRPGIEHAYLEALLRQQARQLVRLLMLVPHERDVAMTLPFWRRRRLPVYAWHRPRRGLGQIGSLLPGEQACIKDS